MRKKKGFGRGLHGFRVGWARVFVSEAPKKKNKEFGHEKNDNNYTRSNFLRMPQHIIEW